MPRSFTARLLAAQAKGAIIVCDSAVYPDQPMVYLPRHPRDPQPWVLEAHRAVAFPIRWSGGECKAVCRFEVKFTYKDHQDRTVYGHKKITGQSVGEVEALFWQETGYDRKIVSITSVTPA